MKSKQTGKLDEQLQVSSEDRVVQLYATQSEDNPPKRVNVFVAAPLPKVFSYWWPFEESPQFGQRVIVPWMRQKRIAVVHGEVSPTEPLPTYELKSVEQVLDDGHLLRGSWAKLLTFASGYYHYPQGLLCLESLPKALRVLNAKGLEPVMVAKAREHAAKLPLTTAESADKAAPQMLGPALNPEQLFVLDHLKSIVGFEVLLLYGLTGSGKTEVYLNWIQHVLAQGKQVLVLLPEINLTPAAQTLYEQRLAPHRVVVLHSNLPELARTKAWMQAAEGKAEVIIGTRLGVFTPLPNLGAVVVDEEHDPSYKQQEGMKYNARDLAVVMAKQRQVPVLLGSATPSLESWQKAELGQYRRLTLTRRAVPGAQLPSVELINTNNFPLKEGLTEPIMKALQATLARGKQSIVFLNRRGFAPQLFCDACGWVASCQSCSAHMVWHKPDRQLRCHHCGAVHAVPKHCPDCGNQDMKPMGRGTQRIEETLAHLLPTARILRVDADSTRNKGQMEALLTQAHSGQADVLVGTQMIAKGHDFANVELVVALNVDSSLFSHSYRAPERLFAQLMQVAGRAGRRPVDGGGSTGAARMMVQTKYPDHPLFAALKAHDYPQFASFELQSRLEARMPPFSYQALLRAEHGQLAQCLQFLLLAKRIGESLVGAELNVFVCDPVPLTVVRVADVERAQMVVESESRVALHRFLDDWLQALWLEKTPVRWQLEVDPAEL